MASKPSKSIETVAVIVSYNPDFATVIKSLESLSNQCPTVIIDNGSVGPNISQLEELVLEYDAVELIKLEQNMGIAYAQNYAVNYIVKSNATAKFTLLLDHDSIPDESMISILEHTIKEKSKYTKVAAVGPMLYDPRDNRYLNFHKSKYGVWGKINPTKLTKDRPTVEVDGLNSSGTLLSNQVFADSGGFDTNLFIDHVETDWCFKVTCRGYKLYATSSTRLIHNMGDDICYYWFLGMKPMPYRSPLRHYYIVRNSILLQKRAHIKMSWKASNLFKLCFTYFYFGFFSTEKTLQRTFIRRGFFDGLRGIDGISKY